MPRFSETLLSHARNPRGAGPLETANAIGHADRNGQAPEVTVYLRIEGGHIESATFSAFGCGCTIAACSVLTELVRGLALDDARGVSAEDVCEALDGIPPDKQFCADIAVRAFQAAIDSFAKGEPDTQWKEEDT